jgi:hypothetical protein
MRGKNGTFIGTNSGDKLPDIQAVGLAAPFLQAAVKALLVLVLVVSASAATPRPALPPELPEDLGPAVIDVSSYPAEYQVTYRQIFLPVFGFLRGGPARVLNSPLIETDPEGASTLRREHPELFSDPRIAQVAPDAWRREVMRVKNRPPCCGACPILSKEDARALWRFLAYDSLRRKTGANAMAWVEQRRRLIQRFDIAVKGGSLP